MNQKMPEAKNLLSSYFSLFFELFEKQKKRYRKEIHVSMHTIELMFLGVTILRFTAKCKEKKNSSR